MVLLLLAAVTDDKEEDGTERMHFFIDRYGQV